MFFYSFFSPSRHLEKCAEVFEKLRVSIFIESLTYLIFIYFHRIMSVCVCFAEIGGQGGIRSRAQADRIVEILHKGHPGC